VSGRLVAARMMTPPESVPKPSISTSSSELVFSRSCCRGRVTPAAAQPMASISSIR
jgi:hypothetical protein